MTKQSFDDLGDLQAAVMNVLWELGEATVGQVREQLAADKELAYTTVLSVLQKLEKAGWVKHRSDGRSYIYLPRKSRSDAGRGALRQFTERMFGGDPLVLFEHLLDDERLTPAELAELRKMLERRRKETRHD
ncbi:MAG: BlaI/MecI/CopY family transcriptional regulator [Pirellulales bacterium]